MKHITMSAQKC